MGNRGLSKIQLGGEVTPGTAVPATTIWRGPFAGLEDVREVVFPEEDISYLIPPDRSYVPFVEGQIAFPETEATFEQLGYFLQAGVAKVTGVQDGAGTGYVYTWPWPTTSIPTIQTYTIEAGDDEQVEEIAYCFVEEFTLKGAPNEAWKMSGTWRGRQVTPGAFTAGLSVPAVEEILFNRTKLYIDDEGDGFGTTEKAQTLLGAELNVKTGFFARYTGNGELYFTRAAFSKAAVEITLKVTFEHDGSAVAEKANWRNQVARLVRLEALGSALGTPGDETNKRMTLDIAGKWRKVEALDESDGNNILTAELLCRYNATAATAGQLVLVNELAALP